MKSLKSRVKEGRLDILEGVKIADGEWDEKDKKWRLKLKRVGDDSKLEDERILNKIDYLVCSTGFKMDLNALPFLSTLLRSHPIEVVGGRPVLTEDLQWNKKLPLFVVGAYAMLQVGYIWFFRVESKADEKIFFSCRFSARSRRFESSW